TAIFRLQPIDPAAMQPVSDKACVRILEATNDRVLGDRLAAPGDDGIDLHGSDGSERIGAIRGRLIDEGPEDRQPPFRDERIDPCLHFLVSFSRIAFSSSMPRMNEKSSCNLLSRAIPSV